MKPMADVVATEKDITAPVAKTFLIMRPWGLQLVGSGAP